MMRNVFLLLIALVACRGAAGAEQPRTIRVLMETEQEGAMIQVMGSYNIYDPFNGRRLATRFVGKEAFIQPVNEGIKWGEVFPDVYQVKIVPDRDTTTVLVNGVQTKGSVTIYLVNRQINVVSEVPIEDYITSQLATQFDQPMGREAMRAVAIVARTDAYDKARSKKNRYWDVDRREVGFEGYAVTLRGNGVEEAVAATKNMVMMQSGYPHHVLPFPATWTAHSAGKTAPYEVMFGENAQAPSRGVTAPFAQVDRQSSQWSYTVERDVLGRLVGVKGTGAVKALKDEQSGRIHGVAFDQHAVSFSDLQEKLGTNNLKSSDFTVTTEGNLVKFSGYGEGHGVGLCLYSAKKMSARGDDAGKILREFFPNTQISMMPESREQTASAKELAESLEERRLRRERRYRNESR